MDGFFSPPCIATTCSNSKPMEWPKGFKGSDPEYEVPWESGCVLHPRLGRPKRTIPVIRPVRRLPNLDAYYAFDCTSMLRLLPRQSQQPPPVSCSWFIPRSRTGDVLVRTRPTLISSSLVLPIARGPWILAQNAQSQHSEHTRCSWTSSSSFAGGVSPGNQ